MDIRETMIDHDVDYDTARAMLADAADSRDRFSETAEQVVRAYRDGLSEGSEQGAAIMAEHADLGPFEHAMIEDDVANAPTRERRAYQLGRLRGFRDVCRIKRWGAWAL